MPAPRNHLKHALKSGKLQVGCWLGMADPYAAEIATTAGFDWLLVDGEHAPNDLRSTLAQIRVIEGAGVPAAARVPVGEPWLIKQYLDAGVQTIVVPIVESGAQAEELVHAVRYPPVGIRGVGASLARSSRFAAIPDYLTTADDEICLIVQVENRAGLAALDDILATDVDAVFIGPADLGADLGHLGASDQPEVRRTVFDTIAKIAAAGKVAGVLTLDREMQEECIRYGATFVAVDIDVTRYAESMRASARAAQSLKE